MCAQTFYVVRAVNYTLINCYRHAGRLLHPLAAGDDGDGRVINFELGKKNKIIMYYTTQQHLCQVNSDISSVNHRKSFPESDAIERI